MGWKKPPLDPKAPIVGATIGQRITASRQRAGITKTALAERVGRSWQTTNNWEKDDTTPSADDIKRIAEVTGVTLEELLGVAAGQEPDLPAWREFVDLPEVKRALAQDGEARRILAGIPWIGRTPTVESYLMAWAAVKAARKSRGDA